MRRLSLVTSEDEVTEPLELPEVKVHLRIDDDELAEDTLLQSLITAARELFEEETGRQVVRQTWEMTLDGFPPRRIEIPRPPLHKVESIVYLGQDGEETWDASEYVVEAPSGARAQPGRIYPAPGRFWPSASPVQGSVRVRFVAGYDPGSVPESVRATLLLIIGDLYEHREGQMVGTTVLQNRTVERLLNRYRLPAMA